MRAGVFSVKSCERGPRPAQGEGAKPSLGVGRECRFPAKPVTSTDWRTRLRLPFAHVMGSGSLLRPLVETPEKVSRETCAGGMALVESINGDNARGTAVMTVAVGGGRK